MKKLIIAIIIMILTVTAALTGGCSASKSLVDVMGTYLTLELHGTKSNVAAKKIEDELNRLENLFAVDIDASDVSRINTAKVGDEICVDGETVYLLDLAKKIYEITDGAFNPAIKSVVDLWGFSPNSVVKKVPTENEISIALAYCDFSKLTINTDKNTVVKTADMFIDMGGIAKGYAVGKCAEIAKTYDVNGLLNLGGNVYCLSRVKVWVTNPRTESSELNGYFYLENTSVCTSGDYERFFIADDGTRYHHIIAQDGYPSHSGFLGVTVVGNDAALCDAISTSVMVGGINVAQKLYDAYSTDKAVESIILLTENKAYIVGDDFDYQLSDDSYEIVK